ncbi:twin arginine-targeting protein translocase, TatA/E family [Abditibacterium utsteinense]|uniref:Twin arginine-targeting protein translocase, TatA/E family n=1 Tax=Abditibacterium utsteinense TaxID=1960156 RepID=A0A2S8SVT7_9BACT|nr:twin-arginine translocase TatA/TatE family subunit [Abditibacterium utsteinense]PQV64902.1 twin arginine-targeting protein translocase, TatA/E family [Abditibacterium utsteinense]
MPGTPELLVIFLLVLILFGPDKLPELAKQIGKGVRQLRRASDDLKRQINIFDDEDDK